MAFDTPIVRGSDKLVRRIATIKANYNITVVVDDVGALLLKRIKDRFDKQVDPDYNPWKPLEESTLRRKHYSGGEGQALVRSGALRDSIKIIRGGVGTIYTNTGAGLRIGIEDEEIVAYGAVQNRGSTHVPARRFLGVGDLDVKSVDGYLRRRIDDLESVINE